MQNLILKFSEGIFEAGWRILPAGLHGQLPKSGGQLHPNSRVQAHPKPGKSCGQSYARNLWVEA